MERSLRWVRAFLEGTAGAPLVRVVHLRDRKFDGRFKASVDASPWGIGGLLQDGSRVVAKFYDRVTPEDVARLGIVVGDPAYQTVLEGVAILVAVRVFAPVAAWRAGSLASLHVRSDSKGALGAAVKGASTGDPSLNLVGQEIAYDQALGDYRVDVYEHTPGVANIGPDYLSRMFAPGASSRKEPEYLVPVTALAVPERTATWWRTWDLPPDCAGSGRVGGKSGRPADGS